MDKVIFWDFDGTLAFRNNMWSGAMHETLIEYDPECTHSKDDCSQFLQEGFPWQNPAREHTHITDPEEWWAEIIPIFAAGYRQLGYGNEAAEMMGRAARDRYLDLSKWELFPDTIPALRCLSDNHWRHIIVSNHVPELDNIVTHLGLQPYFSAVVNSAICGFEKPHQKIFQIALERAGHPSQAWMIGDNIEADICGAEDCGIPGILVRKRNPRARRQYSDLHGVLKHILLSAKLNED
ncbi:MAG: HAD-IA family hydrolase [Halanaerobium sp.]|nr:HAD-IA family hydrolase [Halanaerobium sp.]